MNLITAGKILYDYALKGGLIAASGGMLIISLSTVAGQLRQPTSERLLIVLGNYFIIGAVIGGGVGLIVLLRRRRDE